MKVFTDFHINPEMVAAIVDRMKPSLELSDDRTQNEIVEEWIHSVVSDELFKLWSVSSKRK